MPRIRWVEQHLEPASAWCRGVCQQNSCSRVKARGTSEKKICHMYARKGPRSAILAVTRTDQNKIRNLSLSLSFFFFPRGPPDTHPLSAMTRASKPPRALLPLSTAPATPTRAPAPAPPRCPPGPGDSGCCCCCWEARKACQSSFES